MMKMEISRCSIQSHDTQQQLQQGTISLNAVLLVSNLIIEGTTRVLKIKIIIHHDELSKDELTAY